MTEPERGARLGGRQLLLVIGWLLLVLALGVAETLLRPADQPALKQLPGKPAAPRVIRIEGQVVRLDRSPADLAGARTPDH